MRDPPSIMRKKIVLSVNTQDASILAQKLKDMKLSMEDLQEEQKESVSEILPYLFLGSEDIPLNSIAQLKKQGITHVLNMAEELQERSPARTQDSILFSNFPLQDVPDEDLVPTLKLVADYIETTLGENKESKFLVHCKAGKSRSAATVIAYIMLKLNKPYQEAFQMVKEARPSIDPNIGFIVVLNGLTK